MVSGAWQSNGFYCMLKQSQTATSQTINIFSLNSFQLELQSYTKLQPYKPDIVQDRNLPLYSYNFSK